MSCDLHPKIHIIRGLANSTGVLFIGEEGFLFENAKITCHLTNSPQEFLDPLLVSVKLSRLLLIYLLKAIVAAVVRFHSSTMSSLHLHPQYLESCFNRDWNSRNYNPKIVHAPTQWKLCLVLEKGREGGAKLVWIGFIPCSSKEVSEWLTVSFMFTNSRMSSENMVPMTRESQKEVM